MSGDDIARAFAAGLMLVLVVSSLSARRLNLGETLRMALAWVAIFAVVFVLFLFRDEARVVWDRARADIIGSRGVTDGQTLRVPMRDDGHFWVRGRINGREVDFMVDSGATTTAIPADLAAAANVDVSSAFPVTLNTANGTVSASRGRVASLVIGPFEQADAPVVVSAAFGDTTVLGMSFLSRLKGWRVEGRTLILEQ